MKPLLCVGAGSRVMVVVARLNIGKAACLLVLFIADEGDFYIVTNVLLTSAVLNSSLSLFKKELLFIRKHAD